jgi:hypothetical protein
MSWSELFIIYLATAAPFGVARFLSDGHARTRRGLASSAVAALLWPRALVSIVKRRARGGRDTRRDEDFPGEARVEQAERAAVSALLSVEDVLEGACGPLAGEESYVMFAARSAVGRYAGLALASSEEVATAPTPRETELYRVAGRTGEDLLTAARCVRRRNAALLASHRERARDELIHALAAAGEAAHRRTAAGGDEVRRQISESLLKAYARSVELLSLFDDRAAVVSAARLLDAECARLGRLGARDAQEGVERCTTPAARGAFATTLRSTTT